MMVSYLLTRVIYVSIFAAIVWQWQNVQATTRWQPSIIWDGFNKLLTCKCNWMNIPKLDIFDRVELICPKPQLVSAFRTHDISKTNVYYSIFIRKFNTTTDIDELRKLLANGSFCDPTHNETRKLHTCVKEGESGYEFSYKLRIHGDEKLDEGDIAVVFSNKKTGTEADSKSEDKECSMAFVINVTASKGMEYDFSYDKCFIPKSEDNCTDTNLNSCPCYGDPEPKTTSATTGKPDTTRITDSVVTTRKPGNTTKTTKITQNTRGYTSTIKPPKSGNQSESNGALKLYLSLMFLVGLAVGVIITVVVFIIVKKCKKKKGKNEEETPKQNKNTDSPANFPPVVQLIPLNCNATAMENGYEIHPVQKKSKDAGVTGFNNQAFAPVTPTAPPPEACNEDEYVVPNYPRGHAGNGRLPSVETSERALPALKNKPRLPSIANKKKRTPNWEKPKDPYEIVT